MLVTFQTGVSEGSRFASYTVTLIYTKMLTQKLNYTKKQLQRIQGKKTRDLLKP